MGAAGSRRNEALDRGSVADSPAPTRPDRSPGLGPAQPSRTREKTVEKRGQPGPLVAAGERGAPPSRALEAGRSGLGPRRGEQADRRPDPRASDGLLVNWVFAPSGAQRAGPGVVSGGCADGEPGGPKDVFGELAGAGIFLP